MDGIIAYALSRAFTKKTVIGMGAIKGKNCQVSNITPITDGNRVTFAWYNNSDILQTGYIDVMNGQDGQNGQDGNDGVSVTNLEINSSNHLICTLSDGNTIDAGQINIVVDDELSTESENPVQNKVITIAINGKVNKVVGKGLSTNDFTDNDKSKLDNIENNAQANVIESITVNGQPVTVIDKNVALNILTTAVNNLQNYYLKTETYTQEEIDELIATLTGITMSVVDELPPIGEGNIIYLVKTSQEDVYVQYIWYDNSWKSIGSTSIPLSDYYTKTQVDNLLDDKQDTLTFDAFPTSMSSNPVTSGGVYTAIGQKQSIIQYTTLPTPSASILNACYQYVGADGGSFKQGYYYKCVYNSETLTYEWQEITFTADITIDSALSDTSTNPVQNRVVKSAIDKKQDIIQVDDLGEPSVTKVGKIYQYIGSSTSAAKNGYFYRCDSQGGAYVWTEIEFGTVGDFLEEVTELPTATASNVGHTYILIAPQTGYKLGGIYQNHSDGETPPTYSWVLISSSNLTAGDGIDIINDKINAKVDDVTTHIDPTTKVIYVDGKYKTIFIGSTSDWNGLTDEQKAQYELVSLNDESDYTGNIDAVPTQNSPNAVSSGGVYTALQDKANKTDIQDIYEVMGKNGAKNLNTYPYQDTTRTTNGITFTDLGDGTIEANGTATADAYFSCHSRAQGEKNDLIIPNGRYILSGCPSGGGTTTYNMMAQRTYNGSVDLLGRDSGNGVLFVANGDDFSENEVNIQINIFIKNGQTVSNLIFKPMLRYAEDTDDTYEPYSKTNRELTIDKAEQAEVNDIVNVYGAKNLLPYPYQSSTRTINGVTFTDNGDGTITANGTATDASVNYHLHSRNVGETNDFIIKNGTYIVTGTPIFQGDYGIGVDVTKDGTGVSLGTDFGNGIKVTFDGSDDTPSGYSNVQVRIYVRQGTTLNNVTFKPMIRTANIYDNTWQPYVPTNRELVSWKANGVLGAKNLNSYPYTNTTKTENGITFTDNGDGTVNVNGTATANTSFLCHARINTDANSLVLKNGDYILTGCPVGGTLTTYCLGANRTYNGQPHTLGNDYGNGVKIKLDGDDYSATSVDIGIFIQIMSGTTVNNLTFKPMLRLASDSDDTYQPYAMTNKEITDIIPSNASASNKVITRSTIGINSSPSYKIASSVSGSQVLAETIWEMIKTYGSPESGVMPVMYEGHDYGIVVYGYLWESTVKWCVYSLFFIASGTYNFRAKANVGTDEVIIYTS